MVKKGLKAWHLDLMIWVLTISALIACAMLEYLSGYKAGIMHHLYYRKFQYLGGIFSSQMLLVYSALVAALLLFALYKIFFKHQQISRFISFLIIPVAFLTAVQIEFFQELHIYPYILFTLLYSLTGFIAAAGLSKVFKLRGNQ